VVQPHITHYSQDHLHKLLFTRYYFCQHALNVPKHYLMFVDSRYVCCHCFFDIEPVLNLFTSWYTGVIYTVCPPYDNRCYINICPVINCYTTTGILACMLVNINLTLHVLSNSTIENKNDNSCNKKKQRQQLSCTLLYVQHQKRIVCCIIPHKKDTSF